jgi:hypothetical protein
LFNAGSVSQRRQAEQHEGIGSHFQFTLEYSRTAVKIVLFWFCTSSLAFPGKWKNLLHCTAIHGRTETVTLFLSTFGFMNVDEYWHSFLRKKLVGIPFISETKFAVLCDYVQLFFVLVWDFGN